MKRIDDEIVQLRKRRQASVKEMQELVRNATINIDPTKKKWHRYMMIYLPKTSISVEEGMVGIFGTNFRGGLMEKTIRNGINRVLNRKGYEILDYSISDNDRNPRIRCYRIIIALSLFHAKKR